MNDETSGAVETSATVDARNPWLGLASFTEATRQYFYGREEEVAELARRVQRKLLTVLFGQSGLGKTSILRAGLVPRLRAEGYCPVYVRIDYARGSPEPTEQIKEAISRAARRSGEWSQAGVAVAGESLWEFLHHRDDVLRDGTGTALVPLLIFDQFEEIFTLAQSDEFGRARAARFIEELADLVENRPPKALEAKLDEDDSGAEHFDFARSDYRVLIALREDYLAPLEGLKKSMPSISQNRLRLAPMSGQQAITAVMQPGGRLVTDEVAAAIVRFVAGGAEISNAEVEPSLLSLICRELNDARIAQGREEISLDLVAGSHASILSNFYERCLADQPQAVRQIIEGDLLTSSGFRENVAEESLISRLNAVGAGPKTLSLLVDRRLLRIEERLDVRRVELTHDVLCGVVKNSRDLRRERESREATERLLAQQRARELSARAALVRARKIAFGCSLLAVIAIIAAVFAYFSSQRARRAELAAQQTRALAEQARSQSEQLLGYMTDDFARQLQSFGRLEVLAEFAKRQTDYFHALPSALKNPQTIRNGALAMVHYARAMRVLGHLDASIAADGEGLQLLEQLRRDGDMSEATMIALSVGYQVKAQTLDNRNDPDGPVFGKRAVEIVRPLAEAANGSVAARRAYVAALVRFGFEQQAANQYTEAIQTERKAMKFAADLGALDLSDVDMSAQYAEGGAWMVSALAALGRNAEAKREGAAVGAVADKVLTQHPGYRSALHAAQLVASDLSQVAANELHPEEALRFNRRAAELGLVLLQFDPLNTVTANNLGVAHQGMADALWSSGKLHEAIPLYSKAVDDYAVARAAGAGFVLIHSYAAFTAALHQALIGDMAGAAATVAAESPFLARLRKDEPGGSVAVRIVDAMDKTSAAFLRYEADDLNGVLAATREPAAELKGIEPKSGLQDTQKFLSLFVAHHLSARAEYLLGDYAAAERDERVALDARRHGATEAVSDKRDLGESATWLAMAIARQGRLDEAAAVIAPVVKLQRDLAKDNHGDQWLAVELAAALYAQSLADKPHSAALLREAAAKLDTVPMTIRDLHGQRRWRELIRKGV